MNQVLLTSAYFDGVNKNGYPSLLKIKVFWKNGYDVIISFHDVANKNLPRDSNYNVNVVNLW